MQPTLYLSHGSPMTALMDSPARHFLEHFSDVLPERPAAILVISAHWETRQPMLNAVAQNTTIHDFYGLGAALAALRAENILIFGSGSFTHDLRRFRGDQALDAPETLDITAFSDWMDQHLRDNDTEALLNYRTLAPYAAQEHPTEEHLLPLYVALGAAGPQAKATRLHQSVEFGFLRMDSYAFQ